MNSISRPNVIRKTENTEKELKTAALKLCAKGLSVIPLVPRDKKPLITWAKYQTQRATAAEVAEWWAQWPTANIGIVTGEISGVVVLDVDGEAGDETLRNGKLHLPPTLTAQTGGGGWHYVFKHPGYTVRNFTRKLPGLDLRGDGGYIVAPPSIHESGELYHWAIIEPPADMPEWLRELTNANTNGEANTATLPPDAWTLTIPEGGRNAALAQRAGSLLVRMSPADALPMLQAWNAAHCRPPLGDLEVRAVVESITKKERKKRADWLAKGGTAAEPDEAPPAFTAKKPTQAEPVRAHLEPGDYTDLGQGAILAREYGEILRYSKAMQWISYNGKMWEENDIKAQGMAQQLTERQLEEVRELLKKARAAADAAAENEEGELKEKARTEERAIKKYRSFILLRRKLSNVAASLGAARPELEIDIDLLDANGFVLNTPAGEIDLFTGELSPHKAESFHTKITGAAPGATGRDLWRDFLSVITCGDKELESYLQLIAGQTAIGEVFCENLIIAYGTGKNGKSTYFNTLARVLGDYAGQISAETLTTGHKNGKNWEIAEVRGKRLILAPELEEGTRLDTSFVKKICSTDKIIAEQKFRTPFGFTPSHTSILYTNHLPRVGSNNEGTWRRLVVIPFKAIIDDERDIKNYANFLFTNAGEAVLSWAIEGAKRFIEVDYHIKPPRCVAEAMDVYKKDNDWLNNYLSERCELGRTYREKSGDLYANYREYCQQVGDYIRSAADFKTAIEAAGFETKKTMHGALVFGLRTAPTSSIEGFTKPFLGDLPFD